MSNDQGPENVPISHPGPSTPAKADDLVQQLHFASDDSPSSPPAAQGLAELMEWMAEEVPPARMPQNLTVINGEGETLSVPAPAAIPETLGYRGPTACAAVGISYRQLDYWARTGLVEPSARSASGRGSERLYSFRDVVLLRIIKRFLDTGVSLQIMRDAVQRLRTRRFAELAGLTLMFDGTTIYECSTPDEVHGLLQGGQGIFGVAVGVVVQDVTKTLAMLTGERVEHEGSLAAQSDMDELARRRHRAG